MAHMELACNIRRRHHNGKWFLIRIRLRMEILFVQPFLVQLALNFGRVIVFFQFFHSTLLICFLSEFFS